MSTSGVDTSLEATVERLQRRIERLKQRQRQARDNVARVDKLDFTAVNGRDWDLFRDLHEPDVRVVMGSMVTTGIDSHVEAMKGLLSANTQIVSHDVAFGSGEWTCCLSTVTEQLNGSGHRSTVCVVQRWHNERVAEEYRLIADSPNE
jgi:precorrin-6B methylase 2